MYTTGHSAPVDAAGVPVHSSRFADPGRSSRFYIVTALVAALLPLAALGTFLPASWWVSGLFLFFTAVLWVPGYLTVLWIAFRMAQSRNSGPRYFHRAPRLVKSVTTAALWVMALSSLFCAFIMHHEEYAGTDAHSLAEYVGFSRGEAAEELFYSIAGIGVIGGFVVAVVGYVSAILVGSHAQGRARTQALAAHGVAFPVHSTKRGVSERERR